MLVLAVLLAAPHAPVFAQRAAKFDDSVKTFVTADAPLIAIRDVRVVPGDGGPVREGQTIVVRDGRIEEIGANLSVPSDAQVIDGKGLTALPGLVMLHEHLFYSVDRGQKGVWGEVQPVAFPRLYLAHGLTTIRTAGATAPVVELQIKRHIAEGRLAGPDVDVTGPFLEGPGSWLAQVEPIETPEEARRIVAFWAAQGVTSFKAYNNISREVLAAAIDETHRHGLKITGHLCSVTFAEAAGLGIDDLEHGLLAATDFVDGKQPDACPHYDPAAHVAALDVASPEMQALIRKLVEQGVAVTSTLAVFADLGSDLPQGGTLAAMSDVAAAHYLQFKARLLAAAKAGRNGFDAAVKKEMAFERAFAAAGGLLLAGTDPTGAGGAIAGFGSLREVELLVEAGFTPIEALKIASYNGAKYLERLDEIGTLASGKRADIVLVRGKPDRDIGELRNIETVFRDGIGYDSKKLVESTRGLVGR
jgi:imidazolonepropionase-like amidohydrolase